MKISIVNDTRYENHHGCSRVMNCIDRNLSIRGFKDIEYIPLLYKWSLYEEIKKKIILSNLIIINGEGTLHDDARHVAFLLDIVPFAKAYNIPVVIINATIYKLENKNLNKLKQADKIYVRDNSSLLYLKQNDIHSNYCPDLTFWDIDIKYENINRNKKGYTEGYNFKPNFNLLNKKNFHQLSVFNIKQSILSRQFFKRKLLNFKNSTFPLNQKIISSENHIKFFQALNEFNFIISGRYHIICFCLFLKIPFKFVESNTPKISYLLSDVGLNIKKFKFINDNKDLVFTQDEYNLINKFVTKASKNIDKMFEKILDFKKYE